MLVSPYIDFLLSGASGNCRNAPSLRTFNTDPIAASGGVAPRSVIEPSPRDDAFPSLRGGGGDSMRLSDQAAARTAIVRSMRMGTRITKVEPAPTSLVTLTSPPSECAIRCAIDRPRPMPPFARVDVESICVNG